VSFAGGKEERRVHLTWMSSDLVVNALPMDASAPSLIVWESLSPKPLVTRNIAAWYESTSLRDGWGDRTVRVSVI
jgi:hypothetical protein